MEAAALMALAQARGAEIASLLHVTNSMATAADDFQKGETDIGERILGCCSTAFAEALTTPSPARTGSTEPDSGVEPAGRDASPAGPEQLALERGSRRHDRLGRALEQ